MNTNSIDISEPLLSRKFGINYNVRPEDSSFKEQQNHISTSKYTFWKFIIYFPLEQFKKIPNLLTLFVGILSFFRDIQVTFRGGPFIPLSFILLMSLVKEIYEEQKRKKSDAELNMRNVIVISNSGKCTVFWQNLAVGNVVFLQKGEQVPTDMIILASSDPKGTCYVNTVELDGETNLKIRSALQLTQHIPHEYPDLMSDLKIQCLVEEPNSYLSSFHGKLLESEGEVVDIAMDNLLLRGTSLENTDWAYGIVVYAGYDCRVQRNLRSIPLKISPSLYIVNMQVTKLLIGLVIMCITHCTGFALWLNTNKHKLVYKTKDAPGIVIQLLKSLILYSNIIPISLTITLEFVKFFQSRFIESDPELADAKGDKRPKVVSSDLIDSLGQIDIILTDKTGTLTQNEMIFKKCAVDSVLFSCQIAADGSAVDLKNILAYYPNNKAVLHFINNILCCNSVIPEGKGLFKSTSSEEACMIEYFYSLGLIMQNRTAGEVCVKRQNGSETLIFQPLFTIEFTSSRKKMTVIVKYQNGDIYVYSKGADSAIIPQCIPSSSDNFINEAIAEFSKEGLRSLCFAYRNMKIEEYQQLMQEITLFERKAHPLFNNAADFNAYLYENIESNLILSGAIGLEDSLQEAVPETLEKFSHAGIKVWMLTGDKREIAVDVAVLSGIIQQGSEIVNMEWKGENEMNAILVNHLNNLHPEDKICLTIEGETFEKLCHNSDLKSLFAEYSLKCASAILYRATPLHKSELAAVIKQFKPNWKLLAIGDGANDVSMIREAHVGVGLMGKEGLQASRSSDFAILKFKHLQKLLFVHGSWSYHRFSKIILFMFYKSIVVYFTQFLYSIDNGFSGASIFNDYDLIFYNLIYSAGPSMVLGLVEQFLPQKLLLTLPHLYKLGPSQRFLSQWSFWGAILNGVFHSAFTYYSMRNILWKDIILPTHITGGKQYFSGVLFFTQLVTVCCKAALSTSTWNSLSLFGIFGSLVIYCFLSACLIRDGLLRQLFTSEFFWVATVTISCGALMKDLVWKYMKYEYFPTSYHVALKTKLAKGNVPTGGLIYRQEDIEILQDEQEEKE